MFRPTRRSPVGTASRLLVAGAWFGGIVAAAACSSTNSAAPAPTCDAEVLCYEVDDAGFCGAATYSQPCQSCPAWLTAQDKCRPVAPIPDPDSDGGGVVCESVLCVQVDATGTCSALLAPPPCYPCPYGWDDVKQTVCTPADGGDAAADGGGKGDGDGGDAAADGGNGDGGDASMTEG